MKATKINAMKIGKAIKKAIQEEVQEDEQHRVLQVIGLDLIPVFQADNPQFDAVGWMEFITHLDNQDHEA